MVLSIPRGGVVVGDVVARALKCPHDVVIVMKIGLPGYEEMAISAITEDGNIFLNEQAFQWYQLTIADLEPVIGHARAKVQYYVELLRQGRPLDLNDKIVIVVDDGVATGETMKAAIRWIRSTGDSHGPARVILAVPVCSPTIFVDLVALADDAVSLLVPEDFLAVSQVYENFASVSNEEVLRLLHGQNAHVLQ